MQPLTDKQRQLAEQHMHLARKHAAKAMRKGVPEHEALSGAMLGLMQAAQRYDESRGVHFSSFAGYRMAGQVRDEVRTWRRQFKFWKRHYDSEAGVISVDQPASRCGFWEYEDNRDKVLADVLVDDSDPVRPCLIDFKWMIRHLSREDKLILTLKYVEGMGQREIGRVIGVSESLISKRANELLASFKGRLL
jgi:RNA polymerase sigma factor for flagellar operon FliA